MKICIWTIYPNHYQAAFHEALRARGVDLRICYFGRYEPNRLALGWRAPAVLPAGEYEAGTIPQARRLISDFDARIQVNTGFYSRIYWDVIRYARRNGLRWLHWSEASSGRWRSLLLRHRYGMHVRREALGAFAIGNQAVRDFVRWGIPAEKIAYLPYTTPAVVDTAAGGENLKAGSGVTFVFCGTLCARKAVDVLLTATERVVATCPDTRLRLVGNIRLDRKTGHRLRRAVAAGWALAVGPVAPAAIDAEWRQGQVGVLPSRFDGWGLALAEAARNGLALIGTDRCGASEHLIHPGQSGFIVPAGDAGALADTMRRFAEEPALAVRYGEAARRVVADTSGARNAARFVEGVERWLAEHE